jgi:hypothetical protein
MAEFKISRIRYTWKGAWAASTLYTKDDIVSYGGKSYVCLTGNTAGTSFYTDLTSGIWTVWFDGYSFKGAWTPSTFYDVGSIVVYGSIVYICTLQHTSAATTALGLENDQAKWASYAVTDNWLGAWANGTRYKLNDLVKYGGNIYRCNTAHTSAPSIASLSVTSASGSGTVATLSFAVQPVQPYVVGSSITVTGMVPAGYNGTYTVTNISTSSVSYSNGTSGFTTSGTISGTSQLGLELDSSKWDTVVLTDKWQKDWQTSYRYKLNDIVRYGGNVYRCTTGHLSQSSAANGLEADILNWQVVITGIDVKSNWTTGVRYKANDLVKYGADLWLCTAGHTSVATQYLNSQPVAGTGFDISKFTVYIAGMEFLNGWINNIVYQIGDIVSYGGYNYYSAINGNVNNVPSTDSGSNWTLLNKNYRLRGDWSLTTQYYIGDTVRQGGNLYTAIADNLGQEPITSASAWQLVIPGNRWQNVWNTGTSYVVGDTINYISTSYQCILGHVSSASNSPAADTTNTYWITYTQGSPFEVMEYVGDFQMYNNGAAQRLGIGTVSNVLQVTPAATPGWDNFGAIVGGVYYVAPGGVDAPGYGQTLQDPWASVAYACANIVGPATIFIKTGLYSEVLPISVPAGVALVGDELRGTTIQPLASGSVSTTATAATVTTATLLNSSISGITLTVGTVSAGTLQAGMYLSGSGVTTGTYIVSNISGTGAGSTWIVSVSQNALSTTITASKNLITVLSTANMTYSNASTTTASINGNILSVTGTITGTFTKGMVLSGSGVSNGNTISQINQFTGTGTITGSQASITLVSGSVSIGQVLSGTNVLPGTYITGFVSGTNGGTGVYTVSNVHSGLLVPAITSGVSYTVTLAQTVLNTSISGTVSTAVQFSTPLGGLIQGQTYYIVGSTLTSTQFSVSLTPNGVPVALTNDSTTTTVYGGYAISNMFFVRNGSGIRNMTLKGLSGVLTTANANGTKRPTGGAYVSLDPGFGTLDSSVQISTRSPYIQNVTMFGIGCVGMKVDGTLHASGNKSIVANDFTCILSDGIGAWVTGTNALTELVSVFSYYGYSGYFAENGGKIRATNGNSSYGVYGVVSEGYDLSETPLSAVVNNQTKPAQVASVFAGQAQNKILKFEYSNAGQNYTSASYTVNGAGLGAATVADEFRDNAVFEVRVTGSTAAAGGYGYITAGNQAQAGNTTSITLASNDQNTSTNYTGLRLVIVSGTGVGQYGYIQSYNSGTKVATIYTESTNSPGWDHAIPGTTIASVLDSTTNYLIEPRVTFTSPGFTATATTITSGKWSAATYGNNKYVTVSTDGLVAYSADGTSWSLGVGMPTAVWTDVYFANNTFVAISNQNTGNYFTSSNSVTAYSTDGINWNLGANTGSTNNFNSLTYGNGTFAAVSTGTSTVIVGDGTSTMTAYSLPSSTTWSAIAYGSGPGYFVAIAGGGSASTAAAYSTNGQTWTASTLPSSSQWIDMAYGNGRYVAIATNSTAAAYSLDGITWTASTLPANTTWSAVAYGQGLFFAVASGSAIAATSQDGVNWTIRTMSASSLWSDIQFGNSSAAGSATPLWIAVAGSASTATTVGSNIVTGATALGRVVITSSKIALIKLWEPGSGYASAPSVTIYDPNPSLNGGTVASFVVRTGKGVLGNPSWTNRGSGYQTTTTTVVVSGNGFADIYQSGSTLIVGGIGSSPGLGSALTISGNSTTYKVVSATSLGNSNYTLGIAPDIDNSVASIHNTSVSIRQKYSQCRLTGHDFLLIGTGNQATTNYPNTDITTAVGYQQIVENNLGRVFQTSTDQDGNFKVGNLFAVQQATGIVTVSASLFNLSGLSTLSLGGVSLGTNQIVINQFSTDSYFTANSDSVVPTQRAIKTYVARNVSGGGSNAQTGTLIAGTVAVGPFKIYSTVAGTIKIANKMSFQGKGNNVPSGVDGNMLAMAFFAHGFKSAPSSASSGGFAEQAITNSQTARNGSNIYNNRTT